MTVDFDQPIERRGTDSNKWRKYGVGVLPLWVADMDFRSPEAVIEALRDRVEHGVFGYGPPLEQVTDLHELVAARLARLHGWRVAPEAVVLLPGIIPGFNVAARVLAAPGDGVLLQLPLYPPILRVPGNCGLTADVAPLAPAADGGYTTDCDAFEAAIRQRTRLFLLCNPHNPTGRAFRRAELERMAAICLRHGLAIVSDEIHGDLVYSGHRHTPIAALAPEVADRTITLLAPSKTWNLAGLKCGLAVIPNPDLRARFHAARADLVQTTNVMGYTAAVAAYRGGEGWLAALLSYLEANRDFVVDFVRRNLPGVRLAPPEGTYLAWLDCRAAGPAASDPHTFFLDHARVALNDGRTFGAGGEGFVRLNFACPRATLADALGRMRGALAGA